MEEVVSQKTCLEKQCFDFNMIISKRNQEILVIFILIKNITKKYF